MLLPLAMVAALSGCVWLGGPSRLGYQRESAVMRLDSDRFGILVYPCGRETVSSVTLYLNAYPNGSKTALLRETYSPAVDVDMLMVTTGVDDPPSVQGARREVLNPDLLERFNTDEAFVSYTSGEPGVQVQAFDLDALDDSGEDLAGTIAHAAGDRFATEVGMVTVNLDVVSEPIQSFTCPQDNEVAWQVRPSGTVAAPSGSATSDSSTTS